MLEGLRQIFHVEHCMSYFLQIFTEYRLRNVFVFMFNWRPQVADFIQIFTCLSLGGESSENGHWTIRGCEVPPSFHRAVPGSRISLFLPAFCWRQNVFIFSPIYLGQHFSKFLLGNFHCIIYPIYLSATSGSRIPKKGLWAHLIAIFFVFSL